MEQNLSWSTCATAAICDSIPNDFIMLNINMLSESLEVALLGYHNINGIIVCILPILYVTHITCFVSYV